MYNLGAFPSSITQYGQGALSFSGTSGVTLYIKGATEMFLSFFAPVNPWLHWESCILAELKLRTVLINTKRNPCSGIS